jgi:hypothetical protein
MLRIKTDPNGVRLEAIAVQKIVARLTRLLQDG